VPGYMLRVRARRDTFGRRAAAGRSGKGAGPAAAAGGLAGPPVDEVGDGCRRPSAETARALRTAVSLSAVARGDTAAAGRLMAKGCAPSSPGGLASTHCCGCCSDTSRRRRCCCCCASRRDAAVPDCSGCPASAGSWGCRGWACSSTGTSAGCRGGAGRSNRDDAGAGTTMIGSEASTVRREGACGSRGSASDTGGTDEDCARVLMLEEEPPCCPLPRK
jgi:hypothetical protein